MKKTDLKLSIQETKIMASVPINSWQIDGKKVERVVNFIFFSSETMGFLGGLVVKNLPAVPEPKEVWVQSLGQEDPLEKGMATHCSIPAWRIPWTDELGGLQSIGSQRVKHD